MRTDRQKNIHLNQKTKKIYIENVITNSLTLDNFGNDSYNKSALKMK